MGAISKRLAALETATRTAWDRVHHIQFHEGDTDAETEANKQAAVAAYGRDLIAPNDLTILVKFVSPKWDANGNRIYRTPEHEPIQRGVTV